MICMEYLVDLLVIDLKFRNMSEKIDRNMLYFPQNLEIEERNI